jgi:uncharacterized protein DUF455
MPSLVNTRNFREGPVGSLSSAAAAPRLEESREWIAKVAALEAGLMRAACGWLTRINPYAVKFELGQHASEDADHCEWLTRRLASIGGPRADEVVLRGPAWFRALDGAPSALAWLLGTYRVVKPRLVAAYERFLDEADPALETEAQRIARRNLRDHEAHIAWAEETIDSPIAAELGDRAEAEGWLAGFVATLAAKGGLLGDYVAADDDLWRQKPLLRPAMPAEYPVNWPDEEPRFDAPPPPGGEEERVLRNLHGRIYGELDALELFARNVYEFPDAPWAYQAGMVKVVWDEARHTDALMHAFLTKGGRMGSWPVERGGYVNIYKGRGPLERAILYHRIGEARGMDSIYQDVHVYRDLDEPEIALHRDFELADEVNHVRFGVRWAWRFTNFDQTKLDEVIRAMADRGLQGAQTWVGLRSGEKKSPVGCGLVSPPPETGCPVYVKGKKLAEFTDQEIDAWVEYAGGLTHESPEQLTSLGMERLVRR